MKYIVMHHKTAGRTVHDAYIIIILHFIQHNFNELVIVEIDRGYLGRLVHELIGKQSVVAYHINMIAVGRMDHIIDGNIAVEQAGVRITIVVLAVEKVAAAPLRVQVPKQHAQATTGQVAGQVYGCGGFSNASLDVIDGYLFQKLNLPTNRYARSIIS